MFGLRKFDVFCLFDFFQMFKTLTIIESVTCNLVMSVMYFGLATRSIARIA